MFQPRGYRPLVIQLLLTTIFTSSHLIHHHLTFLFVLLFFSILFSFCTWLFLHLYFPFLINRRLFALACHSFSFQYAFQCFQCLFSVSAWIWSLSANWMVFSTANPVPLSNSLSFHPWMVVRQRHLLLTHVSF